LLPLNWQCFVVLALTDYLAATVAEVSAQLVQFAIQLRNSNSDWCGSVASAALCAPGSADEACVSLASDLAAGFDGDATVWTNDRDLLFQLQANHAPPRVVIADFRQLRLKGISSQVRVCTPTDDAVKAAFSLPRVQVGLVDV
jgi:hypothetical protein